MYTSLGVQHLTYPKSSRTFYHYLYNIFYLFLAFYSFLKSLALCNPCAYDLDRDLSEVATLQCGKSHQENLGSLGITDTDNRIYQEKTSC